MWIIEAKTKVWYENNITNLVENSWRMEYCPVRILSRENISEVFKGENIHLQFNH